MNTTFRLLATVLALLIALPALAQGSGARPAPLPPIHSVRTDDRGVLLVNDKPFFPILMYDAPADEATLAELAQMGFNVLTVDGPTDAKAPPARGFYLCQLANKPRDLSGVVLAAGVDSPVITFKDKLVERTADSNKQAAANCPGRPVLNAIGYWLDEPAGLAANRLPTSDKYEDIVRAIDVAAPYLYPVPYQPVGTVGEAVARARAATGGKRMVLPILQLFTWEPKDRMPTAAELRCMVYLSLIEGAQGIGYYTWHTAAKARKAGQPLPEAWQSLSKLNTEVAKVGAFLIESQPDAGAKVTAPPKTAIKWRAARRGKDGLMILANPSSVEQTITVNRIPPQKLAPMETVVVSYALDR